MSEDEDQNIGFQDPDAEDMPSEMKDHWLAAFAHEAGLGPHPGPYTGPKKRKGHDPDAPTESDRESARQEEANARKMHMAQTSGGDIGLGPTGMDIAAVKQRDTSQQQTAGQSQLAAAQAQGQQSPVNAPAAPTGPAGTTEPYAAQRGPQPAPSATAGLPQPGEGPAPAAPGPDQEQQGPPS